MGKPPVAKKAAKKHAEVKIDGLWGKAGGVAPKVKSNCPFSGGLLKNGPVSLSPK